jgi:3alpha(or 20beta)-hydroxysteroid dehydrogenase
VTGAARGQGEAEARLCAQEGARVVLGDVLDEEGEAVAKSIGDAAVYRSHDVSSEASWQRLVEAARERFGGRIDGLVNNAGIFASSRLLDTPTDQFRRVFEVNLLGSFLGIRAVAPVMREGGGGSIVNVSSVGGLRAVPGCVSYVSSKFGLRGLSRTAAAELGRFGIRVNSLHPGGVDTEMVKLARKAGPDEPYATAPLGRIGQPEEMARVVLFLLSDDSSYCTGSEFVADGGILA